ncbi:MAG: hypothetical protein DRR42_05160 [Gammaproteobacteria bacterium]|nr:MAG: hypothetical protein DRR42_05160 [Gammaproteobacteria bacterium]
MSIADKVRVNTHYTRSINLERDSGSREVLEAYIPTSRAIRTLERVSSAFSEKQAPRAWSLVGPYGSGKSSFSVFAAELLSASEDDLTQLAQKKLAAADKTLADSFVAEVKGSPGMLKVLITGAPEPMARRLLSGLSRSLEEAWSGRRGKRPTVFRNINALLDEAQISVPQIIKLFLEVQSALAKVGFKGVLLIIDELGKFLEYEARHYGANDIYLLQSLAEHACGGGKCNLYLFVMLHQSFEQYAKGLGENLKNEWSKVQGRFEEIPFIESSEQVLRVVSSAFEYKLSKRESSSIRKTIASVVDVLDSNNALPSVLKKAEAIRLFECCYPLHPISALILPLLCQKIAQNERTLFSYLGSHEDFGLMDMVVRLSSVDEWVLPHHIFDYFISNQSAALSDYATHRRWAEVVTALERLGDADPADIVLLKSIGILNIIGAKAGLKPSKAILEAIEPAKSLVTKSLKSLTSSSVITYRKFSGEYRVWQGSDFDLEDALCIGLDHIGEFELANTLNEEKSLQPIVARRYTIKNGSLRYFTPVFVDARSYRKEPRQSSYPRIVLFLAAAQDDEKIFHDLVTEHFLDLDVLALCRNGSQLRESTAEVVALRYVGVTRQELNSDPVAKREFEDRLTAAELAQDSMLNATLESPQENAWYYRGKQFQVSGKREFQEQLSAVLARVYSKAPTLHNELVNRDRPSSQANAGRNKLLLAMVNSADSMDLGIVKFPPEKAIYRSILKETQLHRESELNKWEFCAPAKGTPFYHVWSRINDFLDDTERAARSFVDLNAELMAPPYGVKAGILPILYIAVYCVYQHELAIYERRQYRPMFTEDMLERFVKRPDEFTIQRFKIKGLRASIYAEYKTFFEDDADKTIVQLVRPLANLIDGLEEYTRKTRSSDLSGPARSVRDAFKLAKSPETLLFEDLPKALGYEKQLNEENGNLEGFASSLLGVLRELKYTYSNMLNHQQRLLAHALHMNEDVTLADLRRKSIGRYEGLEQHTVDVDGLKAFIMRLSKRKGTDEEWLQNILMFLGQKPSQKWSDADRAEAEVKLSDFAKRILDLETLRLHYDKSAASYEGDFDVILLKSLKKGQEPIDEVVAIDQARHEAIQGIKAELRSSLDKHKDKELKLAILAELVDDFLNDYRGKGRVFVERELPQKRVKNVK